MSIMRKYSSLFLFLSIYLLFGGSVYGQSFDTSYPSLVNQEYLNKKGETSRVAVPADTLYKVLLENYGTVPIERLLDSINDDFFDNTEMQGVAKKIIFALTEKAEVKEKTFSEKLLLLGSGADDYDIVHPRLDQLKKLIRSFCQAGLGKKKTKDLLVPIVYNTAKYPDHSEYLKQAALLLTELPDDTRLTRQRVDEHMDVVVRFLTGDENHMIAAFNKNKYRHYIDENMYFDTGDNTQEYWEVLRQSCCELYNASDIAPSAMTARSTGDGNGDNPSSVSRGKPGVGTGIASNIKILLSGALATLMTCSAGVGATPAPVTTRSTTGETATSPANASDWRRLLCPKTVDDKQCAGILRKECEYGLKNNYLGAGCIPDHYNCLSYDSQKAECIPNAWRCDEERDCYLDPAGGVDEAPILCNRCQLNDYYKCGRRCIPYSAMCDGCDDCLHGEDERPWSCIQYKLHQHVQRQCPDVSGNAGIHCVRGVFQRCLDKVSAFSDQATGVVPSVNADCQKTPLAFGPSDWRALCPDNVYDKQCKNILEDLCQHGVENNYLGVGCRPPLFNCEPYGKTPHCILKEQVCNREQDCPVSGSDEAFVRCDICEGGDFSHGYKCDGKCIRETSMCDGRFDCLDWTDEDYETCVRHRLGRYVKDQCPYFKGDRGNDCVLGTFERCLEGIGRPVSTHQPPTKTIKTLNNDANQSGLPIGAFVGGMVPLAMITGVLAVAFCKRDKIKQFFLTRFPGFRPFDLGNLTHTREDDDSMELDPAGLFDSGDRRVYRVPAH